VEGGFSVRRVAGVRFASILLQNRKSNDAKNLAKVDSLTFLLRGADGRRTDRSGPIHRGV
jgi:hypothetical protein